MIIEAFLTFLAIGFFLIAIGVYALRDSAIVFMIGWTFIFILGVVLATTGIDYEIGQNITITNTTATVTYSYGTFTSYTIGPLLSILSALVVFLSWYNGRSGGDE
jgi:hypothetical protein